MDIVTLVLAVLFIGIGTAMVVSLDRPLSGPEQERTKPAGAALITVGVAVLLIWAWVVDVHSLATLML